MKRLLLLAVVCSFGCDDETVRAKVTDVLDHGVVAAQVRCSCSLTNDQSEVENGITYSAQKLVDGSCLISESSLVLTKLCARSEACAEDCSGNGVSISDGVLSHVSPGHHTFSAGIETCCTGFNLEAFGVEP